MIPPEIKFDANSTPAQWTDNNEQVIEKGTQIRVKVKGVRAEVDRMYAIATIKEVSIVSRAYVVPRTPLICCSVV